MNFYDETDRPIAKMQRKSLTVIYRTGLGAAVKFGAVVHDWMSGRRSAVDEQKIWNLVRAMARRG